VLTKTDKSGKDQSLPNLRLSVDEFISLFMQMAITAGVQHIFSRCHVLCAWWYI